MKNKVAFYTLGCKVNQYETDVMKQNFFDSGYQIVENHAQADIYIINTCAVTSVAEKKSRQMLRRAKQLNKSAIVVACGCYSQIAKEELKKIKEIDLILDNNEKLKIVDILKKFIKANDTEKDDVENEILPDIARKVRATVKIQDGCNMFCSYCIIPYARGRIKSREIEEICEEVKKLAKCGIKEIVITGIHIASYGKDFDNEKDNKVRLIDLLEHINSIDGIERIRLGSLEPTIITEDFLNRLTKLNKICDHFHLSLQSGCDETLKRMNRKYTTNEFKNIVSMLRNAYKHVNLTTDIIVGFPGESKEEFDNTYNFLSEIKFYKMHIFKYSRRKGTPADKMTNQISPDIKEIRSRKLIELSDKNENLYNKEYLGKTVDVLFEEYSNGYYRGHTTNYMIVNVKDEESKEENYINQIKHIKIIQNNDNRELIGEIN